MKNINKILFVGLVALLSSCSVSGPATYPTALVTKNEIGSKVGVAERKIWFNIWLGDTDLSITKAAKRGKITKIATVDSEIESGFFSTTYRTIVTGE